MLNSIGAWLTDPAHWTGPNGIPQRVLEHLIYSGISLVIAALIAIPLGVMVGHSGRGKWTVSLANSLRAVPSLGLLFAVALWLGPRISGDLAFTIPSIAVLVLLAIPPLLAGTYAGIEAVVLDTYTSILEGSIGAIPRRLMVVEEDYDAARRILVEAGHLPRP